METFAESKVASWSSLVTNLADIAAYSALNHGLSSKWTYMCRTTPNMSHLLTPLEDVLRTNLIPSLTGNPPPNDTERTLFALPAREGGLGIRIPSKQATHEYNASRNVTSSL